MNIGESFSLDAATLDRVFLEEDNADALLRRPTRAEIQEHGWKPSETVLLFKDGVAKARTLPWPLPDNVAADARLQVTRRVADELLDLSRGNVELAARGLLQLAVMDNAWGDNRR